MDINVYPLFVIPKNKLFGNNYIKNERIKFMSIEKGYIKLGLKNLNLIQPLQNVIKQF